MEKKIGYELIIKVSGFSDARMWQRRLIAAHVVKCDSCAHAATHVWYQDRAEYYYRCDEHYRDDEQWTGSTGWHGDSVAIPVFELSGKAYMDSLSEDDRKCFEFNEFDATDYYGLIDEDTEPATYFIIGDFKAPFHVSADVYLMTNGEYCYKIHQQRGHTGWGFAMKGAWASEQAALEAAKAEWSPE